MPQTSSQDIKKADTLGYTPAVPRKGQNTQNTGLGRLIKLRKDLELPFRKQIWK
jgi:hypothetical protein